MIARLRHDPFSIAMIRVLVLLLVIVALGFVAAAFDVLGITASNTAGVLVGVVVAVAVALSVRNSQLKGRSTAVSDGPHSRASNDPRTD